MGSGASTFSSNESPNGTETSSMMTLMICHSSQEAQVRSKWQQLLPDKDHEALVFLTEKFPQHLIVRANLLSTCQLALVAVEEKLQDSMELVETLSFLKDLRKQICSTPLDFYFRPSGPIGAICYAYGTWHPSLFLTSQYDPGDKSTTSSWLSTLKLLTTSDIPELSTSPEQSVVLEPTTDNNLIQSPPKKKEDLMFVYVHDDPIAQRVTQSFAELECIKTRRYQKTDTNEETLHLKTVEQTSVIILVITPSFVGSTCMQKLVEVAIRLKKPIVPINARARLSGWLALALAGKLWYEIEPDNLENLHRPYRDIPNCSCKIVDSCLAKDFAAVITTLLVSSSSSSSPASILEDRKTKREQALIQNIKEKAQVHGLPKSQIQEICEKIHESIQQNGSLAAFNVPSSLQELEIFEKNNNYKPLYASIQELLPTQQSLDMANIHYQVTRLEFNPPPAVLDENGLPIIGLQLDTMFSYQWASQEVVIDLHQQGQISNLRAWFDVYGYMQGNCNTAMATAVENVASMTVFLTSKYLQSPNCKLEFLYAVQRRRAIILALLEDITTMTLPTWFTQVVGEKFSVYPTLVLPVEEVSKSSQVLALDLRSQSTTINGVPVHDVLFSVIRKYASMRSQIHGPVPVLYDAGLKCFALTSALKYALLAKQKDQHTSASVCTRCGQHFDPEIPSSLEGCRQHSAYYMGGTIIAGRWVCCRETNQNGTGCEPAKHMSEPRQWTQDPDYGTYTWTPK